MPKYRHLADETRIYPDFSLTVGPGEVVDTTHKLGNHPNFELAKQRKAAKKTSPKVREALTNLTQATAGETDPPTED